MGCKCAHSSLLIIWRVSKALNRTLKSGGGGRKNSPNCYCGGTVGQL